MKHIVFNLLIAALVVSCSSGASANNSTPSNTKGICQNQACNFSYALRGGANSLIGIPTGISWGPQAQPIAFDPSLANYLTDSQWQQNRILAAINYWVSQKVNYCHHHVPTWWPAQGSGFYTPGEICSNNGNIYPTNPLTGQESMIRWNYSGIGAESQNAWYQHDGVYGNYVAGLDCSDFSALIYNFGLSQLFTSDVSLQSGQVEPNTAPSMSNFKDNQGLDLVGLPSAGQLVCADGTLATTNGTSNDPLACNNHGGYISVFNNSGQYESQAITDTMLNNLKPGDLVYISGDAAVSKQVTHVVVWTGQKIGQSTLISESQIAPQSDADLVHTNPQLCISTGESATWRAQNNQGNWIIADSHYQGPDFRAFTQCFYRTQVWGVRRVIGASQNMRPQVLSSKINTQSLNFENNPQTKSMMRVNVGGGIGAKVVFDTGSPMLVIESSYVGVNAIKTGVIESYGYISGPTFVGEIFLTPVTYDGNNYLSTNYAPVLVVPDGTFQNPDVNGVMGMGMSNQISTRLYLPYPQNQSFLINRNFTPLFGFAESSVYFGVLNGSVTSFSSYQMEQESCGTSSSLINTYESYISNNVCYNSSNIPVTYTINSSPVTIGALFDTGSTVTDIWTSSCNSFDLGSEAVLPWANNMLISTTSPASCYVSPAGQKSNLGIDVFAGHVVYYNQSNGLFGIK